MKRILTNRRCSDALEIFQQALAEIDPRDEICRDASSDHSILRLHFADVYQLARRKAYVISIGKAASSMAAGLDDVFEHIAGGIIAGPLLDQHRFLAADPRWKIFAGGHPLPNAESLAAADEAFRLLKHANDNRDIVVFLISGGGSAMIEWPRVESITLEDLREANRILVGCGASISEINLIRRGFSAVKGGGLATAAADTDQFSIIVSDTNEGDANTVASGPSILPAADGESIAAVLERYDLRSKLPQSVVATLESLRTVRPRQISGKQAFCILLSNKHAIQDADIKASQLGYVVDIASDIIEQPIDEGCRMLVSRLNELVMKHRSPVCLISGGEFSCPVHGTGMGGRNLETVLRCTIELSLQNNPPWKQFVVLSAGTDGIDGNSPAAGAISDETSMMQAQALDLDAQKFLRESDSFHFFQQLDSTITTGLTGTNVRDLRILLAVP